MAQDNTVTIFALLVEEGNNPFWRMVRDRPFYINHIG